MGNAIPPADIHACPLCGAANACQFDAATSSCWCVAERADGELLAWVRARGLEAACLCRVCLVGGVRSPCVDLCVLDARGATCTGCGRTAAEIGAWSGMTPVERAGVHVRLQASRG